MAVPLIAAAWFIASLSLRAAAPTIGREAVKRIAASPAGRAAASNALSAARTAIAEATGASAPVKMIAQSVADDDDAAAEKAVGCVNDCAEATPPPEDPCKQFRFGNDGDQYGGAYKNLTTYRDENRGGFGQNPESGDTQYEVHHVIGRKPLNRNSLDSKRSPAIVMKKEHHRLLPTSKGSNGASIRSEQSNLLAEGKYLKAFEVGVKEMIDRLGPKVVRDHYEGAIDMARKLAECIEKNMTNSRPP